MSLAASAIAERAISDAAAAVSIKGPPLKRLLIALADARQAPEPR